MSTYGRCSVLVVEDDPPTAQLVQMVLSEEGYEVEIASNGEEALRRIEQAPPQMVLLDLLLPTMDGATLLRELRRRGKALPVILMTAGREGMEPTESARPEGILFKPFELTDLLEEVERLAREISCKH